MPTVIIYMDTNIDELYQDIIKSLDARYHSYRLTDECECMSRGLSDLELGELDTYAMYAEHDG